MKVTSTVKLDAPRINRLTQAASRALESTAENLHQEVQQAQVVPRRDGALQGENFFVDCSESNGGRVRLVHHTPYARRLYYHPEYNFHKEPWEEFVVEKDGERHLFDSRSAAKEYAGKGGKIHHFKHDGNPNAKGKWYEDWMKGGKHEKYVPETFKRFYRQKGGL